MNIVKMELVKKIFKIIKKGDYKIIQKNLGKETIRWTAQNLLNCIILDLSLI